MSDLETAYRQLLRDRDRRDLNEFMNTPDPAELTEEVAPITPPPPTKAEGSSGALAAGLKRTKETAGQGITHFMRGIERTARAATDPNQSGVESLYGFGELLLGGLTLAMAAPAGAGAALKKAMENYVPGLERSVALSGGDSGTAAPLRFMFGIPSFLLDPEIHKTIKGDPKLSPAQRIEQREALMAELKKDMTYGELMEAVAMFAAPGLFLRAFRPRGSMAPEPIRVQESAGIRALPQDAGPSQTGAGFPPNVKSGPSRPLPRMTAEDMAMRAEIIMKDLGEKSIERRPAEGKTTGAGVTAAEEGALKVEQAGRKPFREEEFAPASEEWPAQIEAAANRAEAIILEEVAKDPELAKIIVPSRGQAKAELDRQAGLISTPEEGVLNRAQKAASEASQWHQGSGIHADTATGLVEHHLELAKEGGPKAAEHNVAAEMWADVAEAEAKFLKEAKGEFKQSAWRKSESRKLTEEAQLWSRELGVGEEMFEGMPSKPPKKAPANFFIDTMAKVGRKRPKLTAPPEIPEPPFGERGSIDAGLLARMAVGAVLGGVAGDTPEDRVKYALLGMLGGAIAPRVAKRFAAAVKMETPRLGDPAAPRVPSFSRADVTETTNTIIDRVAGENRKLVERALALTDEDTLALDELRAIKQIEMRTWKEVKDLADRIADGEPVPKGELRESMALARMLNDQVRHTNRRIGATGARGMEQVRVAIGRVNQLAREWDPASSERDLAALIRSSGAIENVGRATRLYYAIPEAITQTMYGSMLLGKALVKNAVGNAVMAPISVLDRSLASLKYFDPNRTISTAQQGFISFFEGTLDQIRMIRHWEALGEQARQMGATHIEVLPRGYEALSEIAMESGHPMIAKGLDFLNQAASLAPEIMSRSDGAAKSIHGRMAINWEAMDQARAEGLRGDAYWNRVRDLVDNYDQLSSDALLRIKEHRDHMTFTRQLESELLQALQAGPSDPWLNLAYRMFALPFVRTPVRLYDVGAEYTPGINFLSAQFRREMRAGGTRRTVAEARLATGTLVIGSFMYLAQQGLITGSMPSDPAQARAMTAAGRPPQSFWDPLAQKYRSYKGIEPLTQWISTGADMAYLVGQMDELSAERLMTAASLAISNNINITQFMQAVSEFADIAKNGRTDTQWEKSLEFIRRRLTSLTPAAVREMAGAGEERTRTMTTPIEGQRGALPMMERELKALVDDFARGFGAGPSATIKTQRNMFTGDPMTNDVWPGNPFTTTPAQMAPWAAEISRLKGAGLRPLDEWIGRPQPAELGLQNQPTTPGIKLTAPQLDRLEVLMTQQVQVGGKKLTDSLNDLVTSERYQKFPDFTRQDLIQERWGMFRELAERRLMLEDKDLRDRYMFRRGESIIERLPAARQPAARERIQRRFGPSAAP